MTGIPWRLRGRDTPFMMVSIGFAFWSFLFACSGAVQAQVKNDLDLYPLTGKANTANRDAIVTWEGLVEVHTSHSGFAIQAPYFYTTKSEIQFYYDRKKQKLLFNKKGTCYPNGLTGEAFKDAELYVIANGMRTANGYYEYPGESDRGAPNLLNPILMINKNQAETSEEGGRHFDPFCFFELHNRGILADVFTAWHDEAKNDNKLTISRQGDVVTLSILGEKTGLDRSQFDLKQGANPIRMEVNYPGHTDTRIRQFEMIKGVWVPKFASTKRRFNGRSNAWEFRWLRQKINEPLPYDVFSLKNLGVQTGDTVKDHRGIRVSTSIYQEGKNPEVSPNDAPKR